MNVKRAKDIFSTDVITALKYLKDNSQLEKAREFMDAGATITFLINMKKWFDIHDGSSTNENCKLTDKLHFFDINDERLQWLEVDFPNYLQGIKGAKSKKSFLSKETCDAILLTSASTVGSVRYLLESGFHFVLTRALNSDPIELYFSALRQMSGNNDMLDSRAVVFSMNKIIKTGILSLPSTSNTSETRRCLLLSNRNIRISNEEIRTIEATEIPEADRRILLKLEETPDLGYPSLKLAALSYVGGYVVSKIADHR